MTSVARRLNDRMGPTRLARLATFGLEVSMMRTPLVLTLMSVFVGGPVIAASVESQLSAREPAPAASAQEAPVNALAKAMADFRKRLDGYIDLRNQITKTVPEVKETGDPSKIHSREQALGRAIAAARSTAKRGDLFGVEMSRHLRIILAQDWKSRSAADRRALFDEVPVGIKLAINQPYPTTVPLVSAPAKLLADLPTLPEELEYRLVDRHLLLRDRDANLILDLLLNVFPARNR